MCYIAYTTIQRLLSMHRVSFLEGCSNVSIAAGDGDMRKHLKPQFRMHVFFTSKPLDNGIGKDWRSVACLVGWLVGQRLLYDEEKEVD